MAETYIVRVEKIVIYEAEVRVLADDRESAEGEAWRMAEDAEIDQWVTVEDYIEDAECIGLQGRTVYSARSHE